jgi:hypothetical protein
MYGFVRWKSAPRMFSGIEMRCEPRAQLSVTSFGRSGLSSHDSTPAVIAWIQRSRGIRFR